MIKCDALPHIDAQPLQRRAALIAQALKDMMMRGEIKPGDRLPTEAMLCAHFGVSRTTLRESVQMLRVHGLLEVTPGRGSYVRQPDPQMVFDDLALLMKQQSFLPQEVMQLRLQLELPLLQKMAVAPLSMKGGLHHHLVNKMETAPENWQKLQHWTLSLVQLGGGLSGLLVGMLLRLDAARWLALLGQSHEVQCVMQWQLKINAALVAGEVDQAQRLYSQLLVRQGQAVN